MKKQLFYLFPNQEAGHDAENKKLMSTIQKNSFDVVSMQFAVHYMFKDIQKLQRFINNVSDTIQPGGYFIGTCFDGKKVLDKLNRNGGSIKSVGSDGQDTNVWSIRMVKKGSGYGALGKVGVFVKSIGKEHEEYLVDFDSFTDIMKENGFTLHDKRDFDDYYDSYISQGGEEVPEDQREFSFLNTTFVYRKEGGWYSFGKTKKRTEPCTCCSDFKYI